MRGPSVPAEAAKLQGAFMGSGTALLAATFQPTDARIEFASSLRIEQVDLRRLNDLLRARGRRVGTLLENRPRDEVATRTDLSGPIESPETSICEIVGNLVRNAFFDAILPGLEHQARR